ncbi:MAG: MiaB/RimO family radical SAM methylthiotransferase [Candidatus Portnoybacteria bacterium]|nr:MiaB/RimO family radical SAM methylthiotransferase [Candidatus Portnoybacteria bacterium]
MKYHIITYGCQMNHSDSEKIAGVLESRGYKPAKSEAEADLLVLNSCSVRAAAVHRIYSKINKNQEKKIILAGCVVEKDKQALKEKVSEIWHPDSYFSCTPLIKNTATAYVPIMTGCNNFCAYCVVPYTRGRERSRKAEKIITETKNLIEKGYKEIVLLGQNVNSYVDEKINFPALLRKVNKIEGDFNFSFLTSHPKDMSDELIETIAKCEKLSSYIHLPVQAGDNQVLKNMNRRYTVGHYKKLIKNVRASFKKYRPSFPPLAVSTDIIVGFPGETKKQFQKTAKLMREMKFDMVYLAQYSPRPGTVASKMKDDVPQSEKKRRWDVLNEILKKTALAANKKYIGKIVEAIAQNESSGRTFTIKNLKFTSDKKTQPGNIIKIKIEKATSWGLSGKASDETK